jgi:hypothetical protein
MKYFLTRAGVKYLNETPIVGDPGTPEEGKPVKTTLNPEVVKHVLKSKHSTSFLKGLKAAETTRNKLEKSPVKTPESKADKLITRAYWSKGKKGTGGRHGPLLPGMQRRIVVRRDVSSKEQG